MITGECPYCEGVVTNYMPDESPAFSKQECPTCKKTYWMMHSRIESIAYPMEEFEKLYIVDEEKRSITKREP